MAYLGLRSRSSLVLHWVCNTDIPVMDDAGLLDEAYLWVAADRHLPHPSGAPVAHLWRNLPRADATARLPETGGCHADEVLR